MRSTDFSSSAPLIVRTEQGRLRSRKSDAVSVVAFMLVAAAVGCRLFLAWTSLPILVSKTLPDDAFYYFQIARHAALGQGVTFDGLSSTSGFHPLWLAVITPLFRWFPVQSEIPIHLVLTVGTLVSAATAIFAYAITHRLTGDRRAAAVSCLLYVFNPYVTLESLNGLETALGNFLFAATASYYVATDETIHRRQAITLGVLAGLAILARTDNVFLCAAIWLEMLSRRRRPSVSGRRSVLVAGGVAALMVAPWVAWCAAVTGSPIQSSGLAVPFVLHGNIDPAAGTDSLARWIGGETLEGIRLALRYSGAPWSPLPFLLAVVAVMVADARGDHRLRHQLGRMNFLVVALVALVLFHSAYRLYPRGWYFVPLGLLSAIYLGVLLASVRAAFSSATARLVISVATVLVAAGANTIQLRALWQEGVYPWQGEMLAAARWVSTHTAATDRIGAFNAGIIGYWNVQRTVINLDGVVNSEAFEAIKSRRLGAYIERTRLAYVVDYEAFLFSSPVDFSGTYRPYLGAPLAERESVVARIPGSLAGSDIVVLKINPPTPPESPGSSLARRYATAAQRHAN